MVVFLNRWESLCEKKFCDQSSKMHSSLFLEKYREIGRMPGRVKISCVIVLPKALKAIFHFLRPYHIIASFQMKIFGRQKRENVEGNYKGKSSRSFLHVIRNWGLKLCL